jgi:hypothetical protein
MFGPVTAIGALRSQRRGQGFKSPHLHRDSGFDTDMIRFTSKPAAFEHGATAAIMIDLPFNTVDTLRDLVIVATEKDSRRSGRWRR